MNNGELSRITQNLSLLREQKYAMESAKITAPEEEKVRIGQRIGKIETEIREYEQKYWQILASQAKSVDIEEEEAETVIGEIVEEVTQIETSTTPQYSGEVIKILREIRDKLNEPDKTAVAKLKGVISSIPPFIGVSYEAELDTESFLRTHFPTFIKLIEKIAKK